MTSGLKDNFKVFSKKLKVLILNIFKYEIKIYNFQIILPNFINRSKRIFKKITKPC